MGERSSYASIRFAIDYDACATFVSSLLMMKGGQGATRTVRGLDRLSPTPFLQTGRGVRVSDRSIAPQVPRGGR